ncbi:MAG: T9SS type A sorting domain-containing protein [Bacteroidota bacterium]
MSCTIFFRLYNILGKKEGSKKCSGNITEFQTNGLISGIYLVHVLKKDGTVTFKKVVK